ncbi:multidrug ABC transporter ATPase and permease [Niallia nealsonii AAU1]|nr:multidrug ABC transporter ATPase and permease [Niallia nealsonii AAU1]
MSFVIAHHLSTIREADVILVIKEGEIQESGSHNKLLKKNGFYANLFNGNCHKEVLDNGIELAECCPNCRTVFLWGEEGYWSLAG